MSKIIATDDLETGGWSFQTEDLAPNFADLLIGFTDDAPVVVFKDLRFGYELRQGENIKKYGVFPPPNVKYVRSDQEYLTAQRLDFRPEQTYELFMWCENGGERFEDTFTFTTPRPAQPYPSWVWDGEQWNSPVPYPDDDKDYYWDEDTTNWVEVQTA